MTTPTGPQWITDNLVSFASQIDQNTIDQARQTAKMPFIYPHVALMPDAHSGKGSAVGTVIPTKGAVIPAAVGVDIGCFSGDTRIPLLSGRQRTLKSMADEGGQFWVYSLDAERRIAPGRAVALKTREDAELMRVTVSGGDEIVCTPDHEFMLSDGTYREAKDLRFNDSLMPLYRRWQTRDGYESVSTGNGTSRQTHVLVYEAAHGPVPTGHLVHHKNHVHFDNDPENLEALTFSAHSTYHRTNITRYMENRPEHFAAAAAGNGERGAPFLRAFNTAPRACSECDHVAKNPAVLRWHKHREHAAAATAECNHKVLAVERVRERADVYCLQVEDHHNFALAAGVFVHNCGMTAAKTRFTAADIEGRDLAALRESVESAIPLSPGNYNKDNQRFPFTRAKHEELINLQHTLNVDLSHSPKWMEQLGSLGGGNHFIELCLDTEDNAWLFLHSGSRGVGNKIAQTHIKVAQANCAGTRLPNSDLAYLEEGTTQFDRYIAELQWAQRFAYLNRAEMLDRFINVFAEWLEVQAQRVEADRVVCHHNYTTPEMIEGEQVWLTRKGAINAHTGKLGIIPGSMGTKSYIVRGKGNTAGLQSAPHGAGRRYSRTKAKELFTEQDLAATMSGIEYRHDNEWIDEIPHAYKPIDVVMADAEPLVEVVTTLRQLLNVKGT